MVSILPIPAFNDNYIWLIRQENHPRTWVVDPGDGQVVIDYLTDHQLELEGVLITHHHADHTGGIPLLRDRYHCEVVGGVNAKTPGLTRQLADGESVNVLSLHLTVMNIPGHTLDHIAFYAEQPSPVLFCGDTLFAAGCGRLFEGTAPQMYESLQKLGNLPEHTVVYCAHEYTQSNLAFAVAVEPNNEQLQQRMEAVRLLRQAQQPSLPSTIALERATNPFLRTDVADVIRAVQAHDQLPAHDPVTIFSHLRRWRDNF